MPDSDLRRVYPSITSLSAGGESNHIRERGVSGGEQTNIKVWGEERGGGRGGNINETTARHTIPRKGREISRASLRRTGMPCGFEGAFFKIKGLNGPRKWGKGRSVQIQNWTFRLVGYGKRAYANIHVVYLLNQFCSLIKVVSKVVEGWFLESRYFPKKSANFLVVGKDFIWKVIWMV